MVLTFKRKRCIIIQKELVMQYKVYCLLKSRKEEQEGKVVRVNVIANCIAEALSKAKEMFAKKLKENTFNIFMYETVKTV